MEYTPNKVNELKPNEVFVFGSNLQGAHAGGAARIAMVKFGAVWGQGVGLQGQSYAIPTMQGGVETIAPYVNEFIIFAKEHPELTFLVTRIGCGIAGFRDEEIAPLFAMALGADNITLPESFHRYLTTHLIPKAVISSHYGQTRTLVDLAKALNNEHHYTDWETFESDYTHLVNQYLERGTISLESYSIFFRAWMHNCKIADGMMVINEEELYRHIYDEGTVHSVFVKRGLSKLLRLVNYMNEFRRYTHVDQIQEDLQRIIPGISHCGGFEQTLPDGSLSGLWYPGRIALMTLKTHWMDFKDHRGVMDNEKVEKYFFTDHQEYLHQYGLNGTIDRYYEQDSECHSEVYVPRQFGSGPIYVKQETDGCHDIYLKSCGEGKGPNAQPDLYEFQLVKELLAEDDKYMRVEEFYVPKHDYSLPIYYDGFVWRGGKVLFDTPEGKIAFLRQVPNSHVDAQKDGI